MVELKFHRESPIPKRSMSDEYGFVSKLWDKK